MRLLSLLLLIIVLCESARMDNWSPNNKKSRSIRSIWSSMRSRTRLTKRQGMGTASPAAPSSLIKRTLAIPGEVRLTDDLNFDNELLKSTPEIIRYRGFPVEVHRVVTADGYILTLHRIPSRKPGAKVVFLQHGALTSDTLWVITPKTRSLSFLLADRGYDVWMGNSRGSRSSREHIWLDPDDPEYWDFTSDEMGLYDMPASLNYVLRVTRQKKLSFVGYSIGCTMFFVAMITHPELNERVDVMFAFAPTSTLADFRVAPVRTFLPFWNFLHRLVRSTGRAMVNDLERSPLERSLTRSICYRNYLGAAICRERIAPQVGHNPENFDLDLLPALYEHWPSGMSLKAMDHMVQTIKAGTAFKAYDYGKDGNLEHYGTEEAIEYDLSKVTAPVVLFWSPNDYVVGEQDINWLAGELGNVRATIAVSDPKFSHFDFQLGLNVKEVVYDRLMSFLPPP